MDEANNPYAPRKLKARDPLKDIALLRDLEAINTQVRKQFGPLPPGGLPIQAKRKPLQNLRDIPPPAAPPEEEPAMPKLSTPVAAAASVVLAACATTGVATPTSQPSTEVASMSQAPYTYPDPPVVTSGELAPQGDSAVAARMNEKPVEWPLRFNEHSFGARCHDTLTCEIVYDGVHHGDDKPSKPSAALGSDYLQGWNGGHGGVRNFPSPAKVVWRSKDGTPHEAEVDIASIFTDELVRHHVPREEVADVPNGRIGIEPSILLEVNDRTIRVYMKAYVPTKHLQVPGNKYSAARRDIVLVKTYSY